MTDPFYAITEEIRAGGLSPRRFRVAAVAVRRLVWPVVRGWLYTLVRHVHWENRQVCSAFEARLVALEDEIRRLREEGGPLHGQAFADGGLAVAREAAADRQSIAALRHQLETLHGTLAQFIMDRAFFENAVRTEIMAIANIVDHYRDLTEQALDDRWERAQAESEPKAPPVSVDALEGAA